MPLPLRLLAVCGTMACLVGCPWTVSGEAGTVSGEVTFDGRVAPGLTLRLQRRDRGAWSEVASAVSDSVGLYRFPGLAAGEYRVAYFRVPARSDGQILGPAHVETWYSPVVGPGTRLAAIEVALGGLIYPESGRSTPYGKGIPLPFHWSPHRDGQAYRVLLHDVSGGGERLVWTSTWTGQSYVLLTQAFARGNYRWRIEIDGGSRGSGASETRAVDLDYQP
jgi:hypothetical protein